MLTGGNDIRVLKSEATPPNRWTGEADCLIGPFSSKKVAEYFAAQIVNAYEEGPRAGDIAAIRDEWFLRVNAPIDA